jgi:hypothetical protein
MFLCDSLKLMSAYKLLMIFSNVGLNNYILIFMRQQTDCTGCMALNTSSAMASLSPTLYLTIYLYHSHRRKKLVACIVNVCYKMIASFSITN